MDKKGSLSSVCVRCYVYNSNSMNDADRFISADTYTKIVLIPSKVSFVPSGIGCLQGTKKY